jgi:hypothetical protein
MRVCPVRVVVETDDLDEIGCSNDPSERACRSRFAQFQLLDTELFDGLDHVVNRGHRRKQFVDDDEVIEIANGGCFQPAQGSEDDDIHTFDIGELGLEEPPRLVDQVLRAGGSLLERRSLYTQGLEGCGQMFIHQRSSRFEH